MWDATKKYFLALAQPQRGEHPSLLAYLCSFLETQLTSSPFSFGVFPEFLNLPPFLSFDLSWSVSLELQKGNGISQTRLYFSWDPCYFEYILATKVI